MTQTTSTASSSAPSSRSARRHHWRRDLVELAAVFTAVVVADTVAKLIVRGPDGPVLLVVSAATLAATAAFHTWWAHRPGHAPPNDTAHIIDTTDTTGATATGRPQHTGGEAQRPRGPGEEAAPGGGTALWRMRTTVRDEPGSLAALCAALASLRVDILTLQTHPLAEGTVDEFLLRAPAALPPRQLTAKVAAAGGSDTWIERADAHDLVDTPTRVLGLASRTALDAAELPLALRHLLGRCTVRDRKSVV